MAVPLERTEQPGTDVPKRIKLRPTIAEIGADEKPGGLVSA
jgi:hypothetical protein